MKLLLVALLLISSNLRAQDFRQQIQDFALPEPHTTNWRAMNLWATNYYIYKASTSLAGIPLIGTDGKQLGPILSQYDYCMGGIEGTIRVDDTVYNYADSKAPLQVDCNKVRNVHVSVAPIRYAIAKGPYGDGVRNFGLVPWRTIAVDPQTIKYGTLLYIPRAVGLTLPSGKKHDGFFFAADRGSKLKIRGNHIDVFTGDSYRPVLQFITSDPSKPFIAYIVDDVNLKSAFENLHSNWVFGR